MNIGGSKSALQSLLSLAREGRDLPAKPAMKNSEAAGTKDALNYCRTVYESTLDWYKVADQKGQLLLTLNGIFVTLVAGAVLRAPSDLASLKRDQEPLTWLLVLAAAAGVGFSILCAILCLRSRLSNAYINRDRSTFMELDKYRPVATFWFGTLAQMPKETGEEMLRKATLEFQLEATCQEILLLSGNVLNKHRWANRGWLSAGLALIMVVMASTSIVVFAS